MQPKFRQFRLPVGTRLWNGEDWGRGGHGFKPVAMTIPIGDLGHTRAPAILALVTEPHIFRSNRVLHKCANPNCTNRFRKLSQGKLFLVDTQPLEQSAVRRARMRSRPAQRVEYYWLCDQCAFALTLSYEKGRGVIAVPRPEVATRKPAAAMQVMETPNGESTRTEQSA